MDMKALDKYFERVEKILEEEEAPDKMSREIRDALLFYTAHQVRKTNGSVKDHQVSIKNIWWVIGLVVALIAFLHGIPLLPLPW